MSSRSPSHPVTLGLVRLQNLRQGAGWLCGFVGSLRGHQGGETCQEGSHGGGRLGCSRFCSWAGRSFATFQEKLRQSREGGLGRCVYGIGGPAEA